MYSTLNKIREHSPCVEGWAKLLSSLNKTKADDEPLALSYILESNGLDDTLWCFRAVAGFDKEKRLYAVWCARQVQHLLTDERSLKALDVAERFAKGEASKAELKAASDAAWDVARDATGAALAAGDAVTAAWGAAEATARDAAWVAWDVARAARDAADATAEATVRDAAGAAWAAAWNAIRAVASAAWVAKDAASAAQTQKLKELLNTTEGKL